MTSKHVPVVIVGAGPTGAAAGIELGLRGVPTLVLDRWDDVYPQPRAVHLDDEVYRLLQRLGVAEEFARISRPSEGLRLVDRHLRVLGEFQRSGTAPATGYPRANMFDQPELEALLRSRLLEQESVTFEGGVEVETVRETPDGLISVTYRDVESGTSHHVTASVLLGCDGANSLVRRSIGSGMLDLGFEQRWLVVDIATDGDLGQWEGVQQVCDSARPATYMRIGDTRYRWEFQLHDGESAQSFGSLESLQPLLAPWLGEDVGHELTVLRVAEYTFRAAIADHWRRGRIFVLGDAAHLTPPFIGQGMGAGLRDAANLAWKVAGFLDGSLPDDVLLSYEDERAAHARSMIQLARQMGVVMTRGGRVGDVLRRLVVPVVALSPAVRAHIDDSATPRLQGSAWTSGRRSDRLSGHLCPNAALDGGVHLDEVLGDRWALVTSEAPAPSDVAALASRRCQVIETRTGDPLSRWLAEGRARAALVRPDRTVLASGTDAPTLVATAAIHLAPTTVEVRS